MHIHSISIYYPYIILIYIRVVQSPETAHPSPESASMFGSVKRRPIRNQPALVSEMRAVATNCWYTYPSEKCESQLG